MGDRGFGARGGGLSGAAVDVADDGLESPRESANMMSPGAFLRDLEPMKPMMTSNVDKIPRAESVILM